MPKSLWLVCGAWVVSIIVCGCGGATIKSTGGGESDDRAPDAAVDGGAGPAVGSAPHPSDGGVPAGNPDGVHMGQGGARGSAEADAGADPQPEFLDADALRVVSVAPKFVMQDDTYHYRPKTNGTSGVQWQVQQGPEGASMRDGVFSFVATEPGEYDVELNAVLDGRVAKQHMRITVAAPHLQAAANVSPTASGQISVAAPLSRIRGAGIALPAGAVKRVVELSLSEVDESPSFPAAEGEPRPVVFGPSGLGFNKPVTISLPFDRDSTSDPSRLGGYVHNRVTGRWEPVPVVEVDERNGVLLALAKHFSMYMAASSSVDMRTTLVREHDDASVCAGQLRGQVTLQTAFAEIDSSTINNLSGHALRLQQSATSGLSVSELLQREGFSGTLRVAYVHGVYSGEQGAQVEVKRRTLSSAMYAPGDGSAVVRHVDGAGNVLLEKVYASLTQDLHLIEKQLRGGALASRLGDEGGARLGLGAAIHLIYAPGDGTRDSASADELGVALVERLPASLSTPLAAPPDLDRDCDALANAYDPVDDRDRPQLAPEPQEATSVFARAPLTLQVQVKQAEGEAVTATWEVDDSAVTLSAAPYAGAGEGLAQRFVAAAPGRYGVTAKVQVGSVALDHRFTIDVMEPPARNSAPTCAITAQAEAIGVGETLMLQATVEDDESPAEALRVTFGQLTFSGSGAEPQLVDFAGLRASGERAAAFTPTTTGVFEFACQASDGELVSPLGGIASESIVSIEVIAAGQNVAPEGLLVSPATVSTVVGQPVYLVARATDMNDEPLAFAYRATDAAGKAVASGALSPAAQVTRPTATTSKSYLWFSPPAAGTYTVRVTATDAAGQSIVEKAMVFVDAKSATLTNVDADADGFPAGTGVMADCDDTRAAVHPGAVEVCGNGVDDDCDGKELSTDCDGDGYPFGTGAGSDCDDDNAARSPGRSELCDGIDNNCDGAIDEGYGLGEACVVGAGACAANGTLQCGSDGLRVSCKGTALPPSKERCDRIDNDCDLSVDEDGVCDVTCAAGTQDNDRDAICLPDCSAEDCSGFGDCDDSTGRALCACWLGYFGADCADCALGYQDNDGDGTCLPTCVPGQCGEYGSCVDSSGVATCSCASGYGGDACERCAVGYQDKDLDGVCTPSCLLEECSGHGTCNDAQGTALCSCVGGYIGDVCAACGAGLQDRDGDGICTPACSLTTCGSHGTCNDESGTALCDCDPAWDGSRCEFCLVGYQDNDGDGVCTPSCTPDTCNGHGLCSDDSGSAVCDCDPFPISDSAPAYTGTYCDECADGYQDNDGDGTCTAGCTMYAVCPFGETCDDASGTLVCTCEPQDYEAGRCGPCATWACYPTFVCVVQGGSPSCACPTGYTTTATNLSCVGCDVGYQDNDENGTCEADCSQTRCLGMNAQCDDRSGQASCVCAAGYRDPVGSGDCLECADGYQDHDGDGRCTVDCATAGCGLNTLCDDSSGTAQCRCADGYQDHDGDGHCSPDCAMATGPDSYAGSTPQCGTDAACWSGARNAAYNACLAGGCSAGCTLSQSAGDHCVFDGAINGYVCTSYCGMLPLLCEPNSSLCDDSSGLATCICAPFFQDNDADGHCSTDCLNFSCGDNATCNDASGTATCTCIPGYQDNDSDGVCMPDCSSEGCSGHGVCDDAEGIAFCLCDQGYYGAHCEPCGLGYQDNDGNGQCEVACAGHNGLYCVDGISAEAMGRYGPEFFCPELCADHALQWLGEWNYTAGGANGCSPETGALCYCQRPAAGDRCIDYSGSVSQSQADAYCPSTCLAEGLAWNGQWTGSGTSVQAAGCSTSAVCGCSLPANYCSVACDDSTGVATCY